MKKNSFIQGAFIATIGIVITKILGILYVIPFYAIIGEQGGALYGYAYNIYAIFTGLSTAGIPLAMSKIISEYNTLGYYKAKERAFKLGKLITICLGIISFIIMFVFADKIAYLIIGDLTGGNSIESITLVIRIISTAIIIVPVMSIYRGYLQGHKYISPTSISQILEQIVRVTIIIIGSFLALKVFKLSLDSAVGIAVFGATVGALTAYFYLINKVKQNKKSLLTKELSIKEPIITTKSIFSKIVIYAIPFIMIDIFKSLYNSIDMVTLVKTLVKLGYTTLDAESVMGIISTWGAKINMIVLAISTGVATSLIPNLTTSFVQKNLEDVRKKINQTLQVLLYITLPMTIGISFLSKPIWMLFYGQSTYGSTVLSYNIFVALATAIFTIAITIVLTLKEYKTVFLSLISGFLIKVLLNKILITAFAKLGFIPYYGAITTTILGFAIASCICIISLKVKFKVNYEETVKKVINILITCIIMAIGILAMRFIVPIFSTSRFINVFIILAYTLISCLIYFFITYKMNLIKEIFGNELLSKFHKNKT